MRISCQMGSNNVEFIPVHLLDQLDAKVRESVVKWWEWFENTPRISESVMAGMCECHIPNPKGVILPKDGERIA